MRCFSSASARVPRARAEQATSVRTGGRERSPVSQALRLSKARGGIWHEPCRPRSHGNQTAAAPEPDPTDEARAPAVRPRLDRVAPRRRNPSHPRRRNRASRRQRARRAPRRSARPWSRRPRNATLMGRGHAPRARELHVLAGARFSSADRAEARGAARRDPAWTPRRLARADWLAARRGTRPRASLRRSAREPWRGDTTLLERAPP